MRNENTKSVKQLEKQKENIVLVDNNKLRKMSRIFIQAYTTYRTYYLLTTKKTTTTYIYQTSDSLY